MVYLIKQSIGQTIHCEIASRLMNNEMKWMCKEIVVI